jgi:arylsulfatase A-like enzyme
VKGWHPIGVGVVALTLACAPPDRIEPARDLVLITIDTLRADHVGAYGAAAVRTPTLDQLARDGALFERAWAPTPITLPSHASLLSGRYPPAHGARHNGMRIHETIPTLATTLDAAGFDTAAFVSAFPLDRRFGLARGFDVYDDELPRTDEGRPLNDRPGADTVDRAVAWLRARGEQRIFLWVHLFEPHAPYGAPGSGGSASARYADEVARADLEAGRVLEALGERAAHTLVVATADHGEAFGEHGEIGHSVFVYDTTLHVPLIMRGPGLPHGTRIRGEVSLVDVAPTVGALLGLTVDAADGTSLVAAMRGDALASRPIYAETFAPWFDFGWAGLRVVRDGGWKYIAAPRPEFFDLRLDPGETTNLLTERPAEASRLEAVVARWSGPEPGVSPAVPPEVQARLGALGYVGGRRATPTDRPDPKDRIHVAARLAQVTSGELHGEAAIAALEAVLAVDQDNPQARLRLGFAEVARGRCVAAVPHFPPVYPVPMPDWVWPSVWGAPTIWPAPRPR